MGFHAPKELSRGHGTFVRVLPLLPTFADPTGEPPHLSFERKPAAELMDDDLGTPEEVAQALRTINFVNRAFGGNRVHLELLTRAIRGLQQVEMLEVAAGQAVPLSTAALALARRGIRVHATLLDLNRSHLPDSWPASLPAPRCIEGNALAIPLPDKSVDIVSCCLFVHHLAPEDAARFLSESIRVARRAVLINDLERTRAHYALARFFAFFDPSRISSYDGPVSVRQAYSHAELAELLRATGRPFTLQRRFLYRLAGLIRVD